jgi:hypothetical protein
MGGDGSPELEDDVFVLVAFFLGRRSSSLATAAGDLGWAKASRPGDRDIHGSLVGSPLLYA